MLSLPLLLAGLCGARRFGWGGAVSIGMDAAVHRHAIEGKPPEFLKDWRFLLVGSRWWLAKMRGKA